MLVCWQNVSHDGVTQQRHSADTSFLFRNYKKDIIENIQCSVMTTSTYVKELIEIGIIYQEQDLSDKRKKNILPTQAFLEEMNLFIEYLQNKVIELNF